LQYKIPGTSLINIVLHKFCVFQKLYNKLQKLALLITPEYKSNKQKNQPGHSFYWQPKQNFSMDLIFRSQQI